MGNESNRNSDFENMKKVYNNRSMSEQQLNRLKETMGLAKAVNRAAGRKRVLRSAAAMAACVAIMVIAVPNCSEDVAFAMSKVPVLSKVVEVAVVREYDFDQEPEVEVAETEPTATSEKEKEVVAESNTDDAAPEENTAQDTANQFLNAFKENFEESTGRDVSNMKSQIIEETDDYFTLKVTCPDEDGNDNWSYYCTIDLKKNEVFDFSTLFRKDSNYLEVISENIKDQMRSQMEEDDSKVYWIDGESSESNQSFSGITDNANFYVNADGNLIIVFNPGEVISKDQGEVSFTIPKEVTNSLK
ncbi:MAG: RsiV family protein [Lachnospiraceae bacterium]|nr:RsiV family protein [Lachnospiraceae bacterium]